MSWSVECIYPSEAYAFVSLLNNLPQCVMHGTLVSVYQWADSRRALGLGPWAVPGGCTKTPATVSVPDRAPAWESLDGCPGISLPSLWRGAAGRRLGPQRGRGRCVWHLTAPIKDQDHLSESSCHASGTPAKHFASTAPRLGGGGAGSIPLAGPCRFTEHEIYSMISLSYDAGYREIKHQP